MARPLKTHLYPLILAGGSGTRFWPLSRRARPKQLLPLAGPRPLIVDTVNRLRGLCRPKDISIACGPAHATAIRKLVPSLPRANLLVEPVARNTAPCIAWAALRAFHSDPEAVLAVLPSDHHVADPAGFRDVLRRCAAVAQDGTLCTVGIMPTRPETGYGYLEVGEPLGGGASRVSAFVEKPDLKKAQAYLASGNYLWNGGIFVFRADALLAEVRRQIPALAEVLAKIEPGLGRAAERALVTRWFPRAPSISIDYGVMEHARKVAVIPGSFGWSDLGSFSALPEVRKADGAGNVSEGNALLLESSGCIVIARDRPIAVVGVSNMVVVDAGDALLVVPRERCQDVRLAVAELTRRRAHKHL